MKKHPFKPSSSRNALKTPASKGNFVSENTQNGLLAKISELETKLRWFQAMLENVQDILIDIDASGHVLYVTPNVEFYLGYRPEKLIGTIPANFVHPEEIGIYKYFLEMAAQGKVLEDMEITFVHKNGYNVKMEAHAVPYFGNQKQLLGYRGVIRDITRRKRAENGLRMAKFELEQKVRERTNRLVEINLDLVREMEKRKEAEKKLLLAQQNLRAMASEIVLDDERSRKDFAQRLHDTVIQILGAAKIQAHLVQTQIPRKARPIFDDFLDMLTRSLVQTRFIMNEMSPPVLNELGLLPALEWLTEHFRKQYGLNVKFETNIKNVLLAHDTKVILFHATRELLMNIVNHANASRALIKFLRNGKMVRIEVSDDGLGFENKEAFSSDLKSGYGLYSIRERLHNIGGELAIYSNPGKGTTVQVIAPRAK